MANSDGNNPSWLTILNHILQYIFFRLLGAFVPAAELPSAAGKTVVVTGANSGLGKWTSMKLAEKGATVVMGCRDMDKGARVLKEIEAATGSRKLVLIRLDLEDFDSVAEFGREVMEKFPAVNVLVNNAGINLYGARVAWTKEGYEKHFQVNHLGHFLLTHLLRPALERGQPSRIVAVSSTLLMLEEMNLANLNMTFDSGLNHSKFGPLFNTAYNNSKYANSLFMRHLACESEGQGGINTYSCCPGFCATNLVSYWPLYEKLIKRLGEPFFPAEQGVEAILYCALAEGCAAETGKVYHFSKVYSLLNEKVGQNLELARRLCEESAKMVKLGERVGVVHPFKRLSGSLT